MGGMGSALVLAKKGFKNIHVWESATELGEVGAGINITPNLARILDRWGVLDIVTSEAVALTSASVFSESSLLISMWRKFKLFTHCHFIDNHNDETLTNADFKYVEEEFGYPFYVSVDLERR